jgi:hypothetical protein
MIQVWVSSIFGMYASFVVNNTKVIDAYLIFNSGIHLDTGIN